MQPSFVVFTDFSEAASAALSYTTRLAQQTDGRLVLFNVYDDMLGGSQAVMAATPPVLDHRKQYLAELVQRAQQLSLTAEAEISTEPLAVAVADLVQREQPVLLAIGRKQHTTLADQLLSLQATPILQAAHYPLLMVPEEWNEDVLPCQVVVAADEDPFTLTAPSLATKQVLQALNCRTTVVHVANANGPSQAATALDSVRNTGMFGEIDNNSLYEVREETPADGILLAAADVQAQLIVVLARPHTFLGGLFHRSVSAQIMRRSRVPVLVLPTN